MGSRHAYPPGHRLDLASASGAITVIAEDRDDLEVDPPDRHVKLKEHKVQIHAMSSSLVVRCPRGIPVTAGTISGNIRLQGEFGSVKLGTVSGHIEVDSVSDLDVRSVTGNLEAETCSGRCQMNTKSGKIIIGHVEKAIHASTISGTVEVGTSGQEEVEVKSVSGRVVIRVPEGRQPRLKTRTLSGRVNCECVQGSDFEVKASTVSGSIEVSPA